MESTNKQKAKRVDANQKEIVKALRDRGASVLHLHQVGGGCPDILVGYAGYNFLIEIKDGTKPPSKQKLNVTQQEWHLDEIKIGDKSNVLEAR